MSCLDVMYHQSYGPHHYLPATAAYKAAYIHHQQQQQKKFSVYGRMQDSIDLAAHSDQSKQAEKFRAGSEMERQEEQDDEEEARSKESQPAETEYLSSRCVLFTYFHGDIGDVVDEHFSRALSQPSAFSNNAKSNRLHSGGLWKDGACFAESQCGSLPSSFWSTSYPSQTSPCISSVNGDFPASAAFHAADTGIWSGHSLTQSILPPDSWPYTLGSQSARYPHVHEMYPHMHPRHPHSQAHSHPMRQHSHSGALDHCFSPLLLPGRRATCSPSSLNTEGIKTEQESSASNWPASFHASVDIYDTALDQNKAKAGVWF